MSYNSGIINSATPALTMMNTLDAFIAAHAAWEFVEEVTITTDVARVYKCLGSENGWADFYVILRRTADAGQFGIEVCEGWDAVNNLLIKYAPADAATIGVGTYTALNADGSVGTTGKAQNDAGVAAWLQTLPISGDCPWFLSVTNQRICLAVNQQGFWYAGLYESITDLSRDPAPLVLLGGDPHISYPNGGSGTGSCFWGVATTDEENFNISQQNPSAAAAAALWPSGTYTRQLLVGAGNQSRTNFQVVMCNWTRQNMFSETMNVTGNFYAGINQALAEPVSGKWLPSRVALGHLTWARVGSSQIVNGDLRGWLRDSLHLTMYGYAPVNGDEIVIDGATYTRMGGSRRRGRDFWIPQAA